MHPFALNDEVLEQINGAGSIASTYGLIIPNPLTPIKPIKPTELTTMALGEEGGWVPVEQQLI